MKVIKILLVFNFLILINSGQAQVNDHWKTVFNEQFENNNNNWLITNTTERKSEIISGKLIDEYNKNGYVQTNTITPVFDNSKKYKISFSIANLNYGYRENKKNIFTSYGFVWSFKDWNNYSYIKFQQGYENNKLVTYYKIGSYFAGNEIVHQKWTTGYSHKLSTESSFIDISIVKSGNKLYFYNGYYSDFYLDNMMKGQCPAENWFSNKCGIYIGSGAKVVLDYLTIEEYQTAVSSTENIIIDNDISSIPSSGSGLIISKKGHIVTNYHVIENAKQIEIDVFTKGVKKTYLADVISNDKLNDISILKIRDENFIINSIPFGVKSFGVQVGEDAFALGYPKIGIQGEEVKVTNGIISSKTGFQNDPTTFQISVPNQPGNSGGPLFDKNGYLIGITNAGIPNGENVGYAIKISYLLNLLETQSSVPDLPQQSSLTGKNLPQMVESLSPFTVLIRVNDVTINTTKTNSIINGGYSVNHHVEMKRNSTSGEYETVKELELYSQFYFTEDALFFKKGSNEWLYNKWTYEVFDAVNQLHIFYDNFGQQIIINKELTQLYFFSEREDQNFNKIYGYFDLIKNESIKPE